MLKFQEEIERILKVGDSYQAFSNEEKFERCFSLGNSTLALTKTGDNINMAFGGQVKRTFEFALQQFNPAWNPIAVTREGERIPIVIKFDGSPAFSVKNWHIFREESDDMARLLAVSDAKIKLPEQEVVAKATTEQFQQLSLW